MLDILMEMLTQPRFAADDLERERQVIAEEIVMYRDQPAHRAEDLLLESLWPNHPLGRTITGTEASAGPHDAAGRAQLLAAGLPAGQRGHRAGRRR
jgi:predicted Zn-dependent peptidase